MGAVDEKEFVRGIFPEQFYEIYRDADDTTDKDERLDSCRGLSRGNSVEQLSRCGTVDLPAIDELDHQTDNRQDGNTDGVVGSGSESASPIEYRSSSDPGSATSCPKPMEQNVDDRDKGSIVV